MIDRYIYNYGDKCMTRLLASNVKIEVIIKVNFTESIYHRISVVSNLEALRVG